MRRKSFGVKSKTDKPEEHRANHIVHHGEPVLEELVHFSGDQSLRGDIFWTCCDCGLRHHHVYEVRQGKKGAFLVIRSYRDNWGTELERKRRKR